MNDPSPTPLCDPAQRILEIASRRPAPRIVPADYKPDWNRKTFIWPAGSRIAMIAEQRFGRKLPNGDVEITYDPDKLIYHLSLVGAVVREEIAR
ncbi:MAG: hypothetical protein WCF84_06660, partial [Anaerolineae bacterium]